MKNRNNKEDVVIDEKAIKRKYIIKMAICVVTGAVLGIVACILKFNMDTIRGIFLEGFVKLAPYVFTALHFIFAVSAVVIALKSIKKAEKILPDWNPDDEEDEKKEEEIDRHSSFAFSIGSVSLTVEMLFLFLSVHFWSNPDKKLNGIIFMLVNLAAYIVSLLILSNVQKRTVEIIKKMNPEKKGNIYENDFSKKWEATCDEAEKSVIFESGYRAYRVTSRMCIAFMLITMLCDIAFNTGVFPSVLVAVIAVTNTVTYQRTARKLSGKH